MSDFNVREKEYIYSKDVHEDFGSRSLEIHRYIEQGKEMYQVRIGEEFDTPDVDGIGGTLSGFELTHAEMAVLYQALGKSLANHRSATSFGSFGFRVHPFNDDSHVGGGIDWAGVTFNNETYEATENFTRPDPDKKE